MTGKRVNHCWEYVPDGISRPQFSQHSKTGLDLLNTRFGFNRFSRAKFTKDAHCGKEGIFRTCRPPLRNCMYSQQSNYATENHSLWVTMLIPRLTCSCWLSCQMNFDRLTSCSSIFAHINTEPNQQNTTNWCLKDLRTKLTWPGHACCYDFPELGQEKSRVPLEMPSSSLPASSPSTWKQSHVGLKCRIPGTFRKLKRVLTCFYK